MKKKNVSDSEEDLGTKRGRGKGKKKEESDEDFLDESDDEFSEEERPKRRGDILKLKK